MSTIDREDLGLSNDSNNESFDSVLAARLSRRTVLQGGLGAMAVGFFGASLSGCAEEEGDVVNNYTASSASAGKPLLGFTPIAASFEDALRVPAGYNAKVFLRWGDSIGIDGTTAFAVANTGADQGKQCGMHNDGMSYFPLPFGSSISYRGLLCVNHEYLDKGLLFNAAYDKNNADHVLKSKNALGVSVLEVRKNASGTWEVVTKSPYARRITMETPMTVSGPAAGQALMRTAADAAGTTVFGTLNNCSNGMTPWGTYLTCEENFNGFFKNGAAAITALQKRYGIEASVYSGNPDWSALDTRFDADANPNEVNRFGWIVEIDPFNPLSAPKKRTAMGRFKHENAALTVAKNKKVVAYMGDDERFEYIYKFVSNSAFNSSSMSANADILDQGTLYAAKFNFDGTGQWLELSMNNPLIANQTAGDGVVFSDMATILIYARKAADLAGATKMDRPEWVAVHPGTGQVYCTLTNNSKRTSANTDAVNPREANLHGHIVRWSEDDGDHSGLSFKWDLFVMAGDPSAAAYNEQGNIDGDIFSAPDGLAIDKRGVVWIQTDMSTSAMYNANFTESSSRTKYKNFGNNQMLAADPSTGKIMRFLTGPVGCEITGFTMTPDMRSLFVNIQHPGEPLFGEEANDPTNPKRFSAWPDYANGDRPRSATVVITRDDGGIIGA